MANRPRVPNWDNKNLNKPDEFSSEFAVDGNIYANVTNVATGQRQLYLVSGVKTPLTGSLFTQRTLITSTGSDGKEIKGEGYDDFLRVYGKDKLTNAEINNKKQSEFIIGKTSTAEEKQSLSQSSQYKGKLNNTAQTDANAGNSESGAAKTEPIDYIGYKATDVGKNAIAKNYGKRLQYPLNMERGQDKIIFTAVEMEKSILRGLDASSRTITNLDSFRAPMNTYVKVDDPIFLGIQNGISDQNTVSWGEGSMTAVEALLFTSSRKIIEGGNVESTFDTAGTDIYNAAKQNKSQIADLFAGAAASMQNTLARTQGMVLNPNLELLFQGPQLRPFTFQFKMSAREQGESKAIKSIIKYFKRHMAVRKEGNIFLKAPHVFTITYLNGETTHNSINLISPNDTTKACALTSCNVDYTPNGSYMTYGDGTMVAYTLSLQFMEIEPIYDTDYETEHSIGY